MAKKYTEAEKLKALGLIKADDLSLREISERLDISYATLLKWRTEMQENIENQTVASMVNVDEVLVHKVAEELVNDLKEVATPIEEHEPKEDEVEGEVLPALTKEEEQAITEAVDAAIDGIDGYQVLSTKLQASATNLAKKIDAMADVAAGPIELQVLVESLSKLQTSFFNKNVNNINVLNANGETQGGQRFSGFKHKD